MIVWTESYLMQPSTEGLSGLGSLSSLGCGSSCKCDDCSSLSGIGDIPWSCSTFGYGCQDPITQTQQDTSNYGGHLSQENRDRATQMAVDLIKNDDPCNYSENNGMSAIDKLLKCGQINWWLVGGVILGGAVLLKKI